MRILLFGEYSGLFNCLADGLRILGHDVFLASGGDGYRDYPSDFRWDKTSHPWFWRWRLYHYKEIYHVFKNMKLFEGFDVVHVISSRPFLLHSAHYNIELFKQLKKRNGKVFISGSGLDYVGARYWYDAKESKYYNYVCSYVDESRKQGEKDPFIDREDLRKVELEIMSMVDGYIPIMYEYVPYYKNHKAMRPTIPIPINISKFTYSPNILNEDGKIVFFHGKSRPSKGGKYILGAFDKLRDKYSKEVIFMSKGGIPFEEYVSLLRKTNVVLDDANAYSLGMNSLFSMAQGRIVMGGSEPIANKELGYEFEPAVNLRPDIDYIANQIEQLIADKESLEERGYQSRKLVEEYHDYIKVAQQYINEWRK